MLRNSTSTVVMKLLRLVGECDRWRYLGRRAKGDISKLDVSVSRLSVTPAVLMSTRIIF